MALYRKRQVSDKQKEKEWKAYTKRTKKVERMDKDHFYRFHYGVPGKGKLSRRAKQRQQLRHSGVSEKKIQRMS